MKRQLFLLFISSSLYSQNIYTVDYPYQSDIKVFVVDREYKTDLNVFKAEYSYQVQGNEGLWYFVDKQYKADKKIFFVNYEYQSDLKIFFVDQQYKAGWKNNSKKHLLYCKDYSKIKKLFIHYKGF